MSGPVFPSGERRRNTRLLDAALLETVRDTVMADAGPVTPSRVAAAVHATGRLLGTAGALAAVESISAELNGLGPLQQLARDASVTDIFVNGPDSVWFDRGKGLERAHVHFEGEPQIRALASRLVAAGGRRLDDGSPCVDVRLSGGYRGTQFCPRFPPTEPCCPCGFAARRSSPWTNCVREACSGHQSSTCCRPWLTAG